MYIAHSQASNTGIGMSDELGKHHCHQFFFVCNHLMPLQGSVGFDVCSMLQDLIPGRLAVTLVGAGSS